MRFLRRYAIGILPRYVIGQVLKSFLLALTALTSIFVLIVVVPKAAEAGLGPREIFGILPFAMPSTLPYTAPVALLFAVSVVYGKVASDNEVLAGKAAGLHVLTWLLPSFITGTVLCLGLLVLSNDLIPRANKQARAALFRNMEDMLYRVLAQQQSFSNSQWPFKIVVRGVEDRELINALFLHRDRDEDAVYPFDMRVFASRASLHFDQKNDIVEVELTDASISGDARNSDFALISNQRLEFPLSGQHAAISPPVQELTASELLIKQAEIQKRSMEARQKAVTQAGFQIASGHLLFINWGTIRQAYNDYTYWEHEYRKLETERQMRVAVAFSPLFFVLLGAPVGIRRARGDFLGAFMICFLPIIVLYYPLTLAGVNLGKEGFAAPVLTLWMGNLILGLLSGLVLRRVTRH